MEQEGARRLVGLLSLPEELQQEILQLLDPQDLLALGRTCRQLARLADLGVLWRLQWERMTAQLPWLLFPPTAALAQLGVTFKDCCRRLYRLACRGGGPFPTCSHCGARSCGPACLQDRQTKIVLDIGGKLTWVINANFGLKKHMSMMAVPKLLRCYDCDSTIERTRTQAHCDCHAQGDQPCLTPARPAGLFCRGNRSVVSSHTGLEYCSQPLSQLAATPHTAPSHDRPLCLFCEEFRTNRLLCEKEMVMSTKASLAASLSDYTNQQPEDAPALGYPNHFPPLSNGYCQDTASILEAENLDLLSPLLALEHTEAFPVVRAFLDHIFTQFKMLDELQRPDSCLVLTEPSNLPLSVKELLLRYLFEEVQLTRLCLLPKALAISLLFEEETCVVVDSGATSTAVWVVLEGRVDPARTRTAPVGGWHVSQFLSQALAWKEREEGVVATPSSLDTNTVKQKCRLSLNLSREEHRAAPPRTETLHVRSQRGGGRGGQHRAGVGSGPAEYTEINLSSELFLAPEMMYASLDLAGMILEATRDLPPHNLKDCFSHILIQGGNTDLQGFAPRLSCDLREALPEHAAIINVCAFPTGNHSWNTAMGANMATVPNKYDDVLRLHEPGTPFWISREEYILFGSHQLTELGDVAEM